MRVGEYELEAPSIINAGGLVKTAEDADRMARTPVAAVLGGSFALDDRIGNSPNGEIVYHRDYETGITYNSLGLPGKGIRTIAPSGELQRMIDVTHEQGKPFILNFAPVTDNPVTEVVEMFKELEKADIVPDSLEINASCPNVMMADGQRHELLSHHPQLLGEVLLTSNDLSYQMLPIGLTLVRISPFRQKSEATEMAAVLKETRTAAVSAFNTFLGSKPLDRQGNNILQIRGEICGQSGTGMASWAEEQTAWLLEAKDQIGGHFDIIGSNGIGNAESMKKRLDLGCVAVSATTIFWEAESWGRAATKLLSDYVDLVCV